MSSTLAHPTLPTTPRLVRMPSRPPYLGRLFELRRDPLAMITRVARGYGDLVEFRVFDERVWIVSHPDLIEELLVRHRLPRDRVSHSLDTVLGQGLLTAEGEHWRRSRARMAPSFTPRQVAGYGEVMVRSAAERPPPIGRQNLHTYFSALTLDVVIRTLFGIEPANEAGSLGRMLDELMAAFEVENRTVWRFVPWAVPSPHRRRVARHVASLDALFARLIARARTSPDDATLLARLLEIRDDDGAGLSDQQLRDELLTMILAGHETTALTLTYAVWQLAEHPPLQAEVLAKVDAVVGDRPVTVDDLPQLGLVAAVVKESNRLFPPAWAVSRENDEPITLGGQPVPPHTELVASPWIVHRDPRWWRDPLAFRPERWRNGETDDLHRFAYFPFGGGPRVCIGNHFATMEAQLLLTAFLQKHRVTPEPGFAPEWVASVTVRPRHGVTATVHPR